MFEYVVSVAGRIGAAPFVASASLFAVGYLFSYPIVSHEVSLLTWYPLRVWRCVRETVSPGDPWHRLFFFLLGFNSASLLVNFLSGFTVVLPPVFAFLLGLNVGVITVEEAGFAGLVGIAANPVAWLEVPAACTSLAIGFRLAEAVVGTSDTVETFVHLSGVYFFIVLPLVVSAAFLEASLIRLAGAAETEAV